MDFSQMLSKARRVGLENYLAQKDFSDKEVLGQAYVNWQVAQGQLIQAIKQDESQLLEAYGNLLLAFCRIANSRQWAYKLLIEPDQLAQFKAKWQAPSQTSVFLIMNKLINKSFFENDMEAFSHAWHIIIKYGLVELKLDEAKIDAWMAS